MSSSEPQYREFIPFDVSVFRPNTWGALAICGVCKRNPARFMQGHVAGRRRTPTWYPFCGRCKETTVARIKKHLKRRHNRKSLE